MIVFSYDALLVAGRRPQRAGLPPRAYVDSEIFGGLLRDLEEGYTSAGLSSCRRGVLWALPAYELALMTAWQAWSTSSAR